MGRPWSARNCSDCDCGGSSAILMKWNGDHDFASEESRDISKMPGYNDWMRRAEERGDALVWRIRYDGYSDCGLVTELADNNLTERLRPATLRGQTGAVGGGANAMDPFDAFDFTSFQYGPVRGGVLRGMFDVLRLGSWDNSGPYGPATLTNMQFWLAGFTNVPSPYWPLGREYYAGGRTGSDFRTFAGKAIIQHPSRVRQEYEPPAPLIFVHTRLFELPWALEIASVSHTCIPRMIPSHHVNFVFDLPEAGSPVDPPPFDEPAEFEFDTPPLMIRWPRRVEHYYDVYQPHIPGTPDFATLADPEWRTARCRVVEECRELTLGEYKAIWWPGIGINHFTRQPLSDPLSDPPIPPPPEYYWTDYWYYSAIT